MSVTRKHAADSWGVLAREEGQDVAEYATMMAVILMIVVGTILMIGSHANTVFSGVGSWIGH
jgi:hypothetical protein